MAVTAPVSLSKIKTEFSGPNNFSAYTRGGTYVGNSPANAAISTTVAGLAMSQFLGAAAFSPFRDVYTSGSATITAPSGATKVTITLWGGGGLGGFGYSSSTLPGAGGGSGAYVQKTNVSVTGGSTQFTYSVGIGASYVPFTYTSPTASTVSSAVLSPSLSAGPGESGESVADPFDGDYIGGAGGTASGGTTNINGNPGQDSNNTGEDFGYGADAPNGGDGGPAGITGASSFEEATGVAGAAPGAGGGGGGGIYPDPIGFNGYGGAGGRGEIWFDWS